VLVWQHRYAQTRWSIYMVGDPHTGSRLFFDKEGCAHCHAVNGFGGKLAPDLGYTGTPQAGINQLVSTMWNHAPRMWERMRAEKVSFPDLCNEEMEHLFAFLYTARYVDEPGNERKGQALFSEKGCVRCHSVRGVGADTGPDLATVKGIDTPIRWTQAMWNHAPAMEKAAGQMGVEWPHFENREMNDLLAYVRANSNAARRETELLPADPGRGWQVFRSKSCIACHAVKGKGGHVGPELGPRQQLPLSVVQFSGLMWNHSPEMWRVPEAKSLARPTFQGREIADLVAFLASLRYFEPTGSPHIGQTIFGERGCDRCHGATAEGGRGGPALRGRGQPTTSVTLATALWQHGPKMYERARQLGKPWPVLQEGDVGDIVAFLNSSAKEDR
jgi:mono/diheme cytochrome c family protein